MKSHKRILQDLNLKPNTKHHTYGYLYKCMYIAMEKAAKQAFEYGRLLIDNPNYDENHEFKQFNDTEIHKYEEFEDYLKDLEDEEK